MSQTRAPPPAPLRTVFCTCGGLYGALVLRRLLACDALEICAVVRSSRVLDRRFGFLRGALAQVRRCGIAYSLYLWCATTLADGLFGLGGGPAVPARSAARGLRVLTTRDINSRDSLEFLADCAPDLLVSAFFNQRVHDAALALPTRGCVNIHPSLLPDAKGVDPVFQALLAGASTVGVTVHWMEPELDAGRIVAQRSLPLQTGASVFAMTAWLFREGAELLAGAADALARADSGTPQYGPGSYQSWPTRRELREFFARGGTLLRLSELAGLLRGRLPSRRCT